jgi:hypothetical protein
MMEHVTADGDADRAQQAPFLELSCAQEVFSARDGALARTPAVPDNDLAGMFLEPRAERRQP